MAPRAKKFGVVVCTVIGLCGCSPVNGDPGDSISLMNQGVGLLEQYNYLEAYKLFERLAKAYPAWVAAHVNKGIAALNLQNEYLKIAESEFGRALELDPKCAHALVSRAMLYKHTNRPDDWLRDMDAAEKLDPRDPHLLYLRAEVLMEKGRVDEARAILEKVIKLQPSFSSAYWRLREAFVKTGDRGKMLAAIEAFKRLQDSEMGITFGLKYGEGGKYSRAIRDSVLPGWKGPAPAWKAPDAPAFGPRVKISGGPAMKRVRPDGKPQAPAFALGDLDGDGQLEMVLCSEASAGGAGGTAGVTIYSLDRAGAWNLRDKLPDDAVCCALGDIDGDFDTDVVLAGDGWLRIYLNDGKGKLTAQELKANGASFAGFPVRLYVLDADSDWDLDIVCLRQEKTAGGKVRSRIQILNNNRDGTFQEISTECGIPTFDFPAVELIAADLDGDIDADFLVFDGTTGASVAYANDRVWRYHRVETGDAAPKAPGLVSTAGGDFDGDGDQDLVLFCGDTLRFWKNAGGLLFEEDAAFAQRFGKIGGPAGALADFQGALRSSLIALDARGNAAGNSFIASADSEKAVPLELVGGGARGDISATAAVIAPCGAPSLIVYDDEMGAGLYEMAAPAKWLVLDLEGAKKPVPKLERSNAAGVGASVEVRAGTKKGRFLLDSGSGGAARSSPRMFCGLGGASSSDYVRILWPDSVLQTEIGLIPGCVQKLKEIERKPTSCPILFAWTGSRYEFVADFLGVGGLGYLELPGVYTKPDPSEYVLLPPLVPIEGEYRLDILEPLEECTYLDELKLTAVDHPDDVTVIPEEMFAVKGPAPGFRVLAFREKLFAVSAMNSEGADVTRELRDVDRRYANRVERDERFPGLAKSMHWIDLDLDGGIGAMLEGAKRAGRPARPYLFLHGYVEYGYSTSNFAAWQAKAEFHAPSVRVVRGGKWVTLRDEWGFPAGYPRYMAIDLSGLLEPGDRRLRVDTNMDIHWDQAFLADASEESSLEVTDLDADVALLGFRGFPREESPDGSTPFVYVHKAFEPDASYKTFPGNYTRYGDVRALLSKADDRFAILGPGDGLSVSVRADRLPPLAQGRKRTFIAKTFGYCKDMDLYTAHPDRVEPLPFRSMSGYPYRTDEAVPSAAAQEAYSREWNTRTVR